MCSLVFYKTFLGVEPSFFLKVQRSYFRRLRVSLRNDWLLSKKMWMFLVDVL